MHTYSTHTVQMELLMPVAMASVSAAPPIACVYLQKASFILRGLPDVE